MQLGSVNKCGRIPVDQAIQETANREIKAPGDCTDQCCRKILSHSLIWVLVSVNCGISLMIKRVLSTIQICGDLRISRTKQDIERCEIIV